MSAQSDNDTTPFPCIFILPTRLAPTELAVLQIQVPTVTDDILDADVIVGRLSKRERALFELRHYNITIDEGDQDEEGLSTDSDEDEDEDEDEVGGRHGCVTLVKLAWLTDSLERGEALPVNDDGYLILAGTRKPRDQSLLPHRPTAAPPPAAPVIKRKASAVYQGAHTYTHTLAHRKPIPTSTPNSNSNSNSNSKPQSPALLHESTSEHAAFAHSSQHPLPASVLVYLHAPYACQRPTPNDPANSGFIEELKRIRKARTLLGDDRRARLLDRHRRVGGVSAALAERGRGCGAAWVRGADRAAVSGVERDGAGVGGESDREGARAGGSGTVL